MSHHIPTTTPTEPATTTRRVATELNDMHRSSRPRNKHRHPSVPGSGWRRGERLGRGRHPIQSRSASRAPRRVVRLATQSRGRGQDFGVNSSAPAGGCWASRARCQKSGSTRRFLCRSAADSPLTSRPAEQRVGRSSGRHDPQWRRRQVATVEGPISFGGA